jgi:CheY-like chemotaxis protein
MKILIADNEKDFVDMLKERLSCKGHSVDAAYDGGAAMELIKNGGYDILFLDHNMPEMTGLEIAKYVKEHNINSKTVIVTGYEQMSDSFAKAIAADEYITKPAKLKEIDDIISKYGGDPCR